MFPSTTNTQRLTAKSYKLKANFGFTLIEMLVVVAIISLLSIAAFLTLQSSPEQAKIATSQAIVDKLMAGLIAYRIDTGQWPPAYRPIGAAASNPLMVNPGVAGWRGPYLNTYTEIHPWNGGVGFGIGTNGRMFIVLDDDNPLGSANNNQGIIPDASLLALDEILDNGNLANGDVVGDRRETPVFSQPGELVIYIDD